MTAISPPGAAHSTLAATDGALVAGFDLLLVDLDGVAYLGDEPIEGAAPALRAARDAGLSIMFVTNNASRPPAAVATQLEAMGVSAAPAEVMTSAIAAASVLAGRFPAGSPVLVVGGAGVREALDAAGLRAVASADDQPVAVMQGFARDVGWPMLAEASIALRAGAAWVATNDDVTLPSPRGPLPGNGSLVAALKAATGLTPDVIGKPGPALFAAAIAASGGQRPLVIGDRLDTDIAGARAASLPSLLVLSGVSQPIDVLAAPPQQRPDYIGRDLRTLDLAQPETAYQSGVATCGGVVVTRDGDAVTVSAASRKSGDPADGPTDGLDGLRALCAVAWDDESPWTDRRREMYQQALAGLDLN